MAKAAVIVESPAKVKTINKILGDKFKVIASMGHLIDLPKSTLGVDVDHDFAPKFIVVRSKQKILTKLKADTKSVKEIYFATDPDREGEAIGWNLQEVIGKDKKIFRVTFQEITKDAVLKAFENCREFNQDLINAQVGRRILDRIVGYKISPILWKKVGSRLSAGRVQSVALRIIVERERAIQKFIPQEYWEIEVDLNKSGLKDVLVTSLEKINDKKIEFLSEIDSRTAVSALKNEKFVISQVSEKEIKRKSNPPFITSTLQQDSFNKHRFNASKTMMLAQQLYEGVDIGQEETMGLITYMRTDSVNISKEAIEKVRKFIGSKYGAKYLPSEPNVFKSKKNAQEAHEAIRPTDVERTPERVKNFLDSDQLKLYELIWNRFVCSQMTQSVSLSKRIEISAGSYSLSTSGSTLVFDGFLAVDRDTREEESKVDLAPYKEGDELKLVEIKPSQHFTKPPARFSDASLVKALEEAGIGRPSTYASIMHTLIFRNYVVREKGYLSPTVLGMQICDILMEHFKTIMDITFTAKMEESLDLVEEGKLQYPDLLREFYTPFEEELKSAESKIVKTENFVDKVCPLCAKQLVIKWGRRGKFLSCSGFPECKHAQPITTGTKCPKDGCDGELVSRRSKRGTFFGCSRYPQCDFISNELPKEGASENSGISGG